MSRLSVSRRAHFVSSRLMVMKCDSLLAGLETIKGRPVTCGKNVSQKSRNEPHMSERISGISIVFCILFNQRINRSL